MDLTKKTTILFSPDLHRRLVRLAEVEGLSLGELVRRACEAQYRLASPDQRLAAVRELAGLSLPVDTPAKMEIQSVPSPEELLP